LFADHGDGLELEEHRLNRDDHRRVLALEHAVPLARRGSAPARRAAVFLALLRLRLLCLFRKSELAPPLVLFPLVMLENADHREWAPVKQDRFAERLVIRRPLRP